MNDHLVFYDDDEPDDRIHFQVRMPRQLLKAWPFDNDYDYPSIDTMISTDTFTGWATLRIFCNVRQERSVIGVWCYDDDGIIAAHDLVYRADHIQHNPFIMLDAEVPIPLYYWDDEEEEDEDDEWDPPWED